MNTQSSMNQEAAMAPEADSITFGPAPVEPAQQAVFELKNLEVHYGTFRAVRGGATLIPLPPASVTPALARCRCPRWKLGTVSVRSIAALRVTVTIMSG